MIEDRELPGQVLGHPIQVRVQRPVGPGPWPFCVLLHGYTLFSEWGYWPELARRLAAAGVASARINLSGDGLAADRMTVANRAAVLANTYVAEVDDLHTVARFVRSLPDTDGRFGYVGHSRGGAMGIVHAAEAGDYRVVVTHAAMDAILQFTRDRLEQWRANGSVDVMHHGLGERIHLPLATLEAAEAASDRVNILDACRRLTAPLHVVHGTRDVAVSLAAARRLAAAAPHGELHVISGAGHAFGARQPFDAVPARLERLLGRTMASVLDAFDL